MMTQMNYAMQPITATVMLPFSACGGLFSAVMPTALGIGVPAKTLCKASSAAWMTNHAALLSALGFYLRYGP